MAKEPIPRKEYLIPINYYFLSAGNTFLYRVVSGPCCRIYWQHYDDPDLSNAAKERMNWVDKVAITPWKTESAWYEKSEGNWTRNGANYPSYNCQLICDTTGDIITESVDVTLRWIPIQSQDFNQMINIIKERKCQFQNQPQRPQTIQLSEQKRLRMLHPAEKQSFTEPIAELKMTAQEKASRM